MGPAAPLLLPGGLRLSEDEFLDHTGCARSTGAFRSAAGQRCCTKDDWCSGAAEEDAFIRRSKRHYEAVSGADHSAQKNASLCFNSLKRRMLLVDSRDCFDVPRAGFDGPSCLPLLRGTSSLDEGCLDEILTRNPCNRPSSAVDQGSAPLGDSVAHDTTMQRLPVHQEERFTSRLHPIRGNILPRSCEH